MKVYCNNFSPFEKKNEWTKENISIYLNYDLISYSSFDSNYYRKLVSGSCITYIKIMLYIWYTKAVTKHGSHISMWKIITVINIKSYELLKCPHRCCMLHQWILIFALKGKRKSWFQLIALSVA